jgi:hypothetical protein
MLNLMIIFIEFMSFLFFFLLSAFSLFPWRTWRLGGSILLFILNFAQFRFGSGDQFFEFIVIQQQGCQRLDALFDQRDQLGGS